MTYLGGERAVPHYNVMGVAKATLDSSVRYLAWDLGQKNIRVNAVSAGPVRTLAARSIAGFPTMESIVEERSPLHRPIDAADVAGAAAYLLSRRRAERHRAPRCTSTAGTTRWACSYGWLRLRRDPDPARGPGSPAGGESRRWLSTTESATSASLRPVRWECSRRSSKAPSALMP